MAAKNTLVERVKDNLVYHAVDSTALLAETTPIYAAFEIWVAGIPEDVSQNARLISVGVMYCGLGFMYGKGRDLWRNVFRINSKTKERTQLIHDLAYTGIYSLILAPPIYIASGASSLKEIIAGTALAVVLGASNGPILGYAVDLLRDLTGLEDCGRPSYPRIIKRQGKMIKKGIAALLLAGAIGLTALVYALTPDKETANYQQPFIQEIVKSEDNSELKTPTERFIKF
jgi:hypothetical protein